MKRILLAALLASSFVSLTASADTAAAPAAPAAKEETWTGKIEKKDATNVEFVAGGKKYDVNGAIESQLMKEVGKEVKLTGTMNGMTITAVKAEPVTVTK